MGEVLGVETGLSMPSWNIFQGVSGWTIALIMVIVVVLILGAVGFWLIYSWRVFRYKIWIFENTGHGYRLVGKDRARLIKVGDGGEEILWLKRRKVYRAAYGRKMGKNTYWFAIGQDGYWYNVVLGDVDAKLGMLDIEPIDRYNTRLLKLQYQIYKSKVLNGKEKAKLCGVSPETITAWGKIPVKYPEIFQENKED